ncbi:MAG: hypothetical protein N0C84_07505 [Candidatus Thiodiazotropha taylori]|uniref:Uncharacterized protein n=1 Tax=Candidatus Thiodiazotropha taylori TaxID=2792791 RepID=A0A9E4N2Y7_9GAMM|nr:hypothetical protein [Candidatus Thiodiazotropha taylori]MCW4256300.1 hypothetical protein [Candidatus Thiodiazotropha taylori]
MPGALRGTPIDWNIVVVGAWNVAILTPEGIARRLFNLEPGTPIQVQVAMDVGAPIRVRHDNIIVQPSPTSLVITPQESTPEALANSVTIAQRALDSLPETPMTAAGLNIRYQYEQCPDSLIEAGNSVIDDKLTDAAFEITEKMLKRKIVWDDGVLNLDVHERDDASALVVFNYHKNSNLPGELGDWLGKHAQMLENCATIIDTLVEEE